MSEKKDTMTKVETVGVVEAVNSPEETVEMKESRYHTIKAVRETRESFKKRVDSYNEKYIKKTVDAGRDFMKELQEDPLKRIDGLIEESTKAVKTLKSDSRKKYDEVKARSKEISGKLKESPFKYVGEVVKDVRTDTDKKFEKYRENGKKFFEGVEKDVTVIRKDLVDAGKKAIDSLPMKKSVEKQITRSIEKFPSILNLPSKKEVEELIKGIDNVSKKVDSLSKQSFAA